MKRSREVEVNFEVECDDFTVPEWPGLRCWAKFEAYGFVTFDESGDSVTPDAPPFVSVNLLDVKSYGITLEDIDLPEWLEAQLANDGGKFDAAFLSAIGGQGRLDDLAIEKAM